VHRPVILCKDAVDDPSILDEHIIVHAVHPKHWVPVKGGPGFRIASVSFNESTDGTGNSSNLWEVLEKLGLPKTFMPPPPERWKDHGFVEFAGALPRGFGVKLVRMPLEGNDAHAGLCNISDDAKTALTRRSTVLTLGNPALKK
jgi:hypothetical protein